LNYRVANAALTSPTFTAEAIDPPEIANVQLVLYPPAYAGLGSVSVPEGGIEGLKGSTIRLDAVATKDVVKAEIMMDDGKKIPLKVRPQIASESGAVPVPVVSNSGRRPAWLSQHADQL
jgi:hypothetical protein